MTVDQERLAIALLKLVLEGGETWPPNDDAGWRRLAEAARLRIEFDENDFAAVRRRMGS